MLMNGGAFGVVNFVSGGLTTMVPLGNSDLTDGPQTQNAEPSAEIPIWSHAAVIDAFLMSDNRDLQALGRHMTGLRVYPDLDPGDIARMAERLRDLCAEDVGHLRGQTPVGYIRFASHLVGRREAARLLEGTPTGPEALSQLLALAGRAMDKKQYVVAGILRDRICHRLALHSSDIGPEHLEDLLKLAMVREMMAVLNSLNAWVLQNPDGTTQLFERKHLPLVIQVASEERHIDSKTILAALLGQGADKDLQIRKELFQPEDLYPLFDMLGYDKIMHGLRQLAASRPEIFRADHAAWLMAMEQYFCPWCSSGNPYKAVLDILLTTRLDLFHPLSLIDRVKRNLRSNEGALRAAQEIRRRAEASAAA